MWGEINFNWFPLFAVVVKEDCILGLQQPKLLSEGKTEKKLQNGGHWVLFNAHGRIKSALLALSQLFFAHISLFCWILFDDIFSNFGLVDKIARESISMRFVAKKNTLWLCLIRFSDFTEAPHNTYIFSRQGHFLSVIVTNCDFKILLSNNTHWLTRKWSMLACKEHRL